MNVKTILLAAFSLPVATFSMAHDEPPIQFNHGRVNPNDPFPPVPKSPIQIPLVYKEGSTLTFATPCTGCTLQLLDSNREVVFETEVASSTTTVILPASLAGTYELRLIYGGYYFYADIAL